MACDISARLLHSTRRRGASAPEQSGTGTRRQRCGYGSAPVHRHPQRVGYRDLRYHRALPAGEQESGLEAPARPIAACQTTEAVSLRDARDPVRVVQYDERSVSFIFWWTREVKNHALDRYR